MPEEWSQDPLAYSPFPGEWPAAAAYPKAILVDQPFQAFAAYENGRLVRWGPVSTGRKDTPTPDGTFHLTWRARSRRSTDNEDWLLEWYFNFVNERGVSFHLFDLPGIRRATRACGCCCAMRSGCTGGASSGRWSRPAARWRRRARSCVIEGTFPFGTPPAWLSLDALVGAARAARGAQRTSAAMGSSRGEARRLCDGPCAGASFRSGCGR